MKKPKYSDPLDALGAVYETMYEHFAEDLHQAREKSRPLIHELVDEAKEKAVKLGHIAEEDADKISVWLKRDLDETVHYIVDTEEGIREWLGFETSLIKSEVIRMLLETANKTTLQWLRMKENAHQPATYKTGEIAGPGTLICDECGEKLHFHMAGHIPPCPKCNHTEFHRIQID